METNKQSSNKKRTFKESIIERIIALNPTKWKCRRDGGDFNDDMGGSWWEITYTTKIESYAIHLIDHSGEYFIRIFEESDLASPIVSINDCKDIFKTIDQKVTSYGRGTEIQEQRQYEKSITTRKKKALKGLSKIYGVTA